MVALDIFPNILQLYASALKCRKPTAGDRHVSCSSATVGGCLKKMGQPSRTNEEMKKRKRDELVEPGENADQLPDKRHLPAIPQLDATRPNIYQLVIGSYHRVLQGIVIKVDSAGRSGETHGQSDIARARQQTVEFITNFLFEAHTASIRSIAVSAPPATNLSADASNLNSSHKVLLATGGADERINLYQLSAAYRPSPAIVEIQPHSQLGAMSLDSAENETASQFPVNKAVGTLLHHQGTITALKFPTRGKLISGATDNTIAVTRTRDWAVLTTMKAPKPRASGRPDGDTAAADSIPAGINALAVHPSAKLMISVGKNERCMRLWNLVTGKKAGALMFDSKILSKVGNSRWERAEAKKVEWSATGQEFCILFERAAVVYGEVFRHPFAVASDVSSIAHD